MPSITYPDYKISKAAEAAPSSRQMTVAVFDEIDLWFSKLVPKFEEQWKTGINNKITDGELLMKLGGLVTQVNFLKKPLVTFINREIIPQNGFSVNEFVLPRKVASNNGTKSALPILVKIGKTFQAMKDYFTGILNRVRQYYLAAADKTPKTLQMGFRLSNVVGQLNVLKDMLLDLINDEITRKENKSSGFSAGDGDNEEAEFKKLLDNNSSLILKLVMDVEIGDNEMLAPIEDESIEVEGFTKD